MKRDLVVPGDAHYLECQLLEADKNCRRYLVESEQQAYVCGELLRCRFDCVAEYDEPRPDYVEVKAHDLHGKLASAADQQQESKQRSIADANGARYVRVYRSDLEKRRTWLSSVARGIAALTAAQNHSLVRSNTDLFALFEQKPEWRVGELYAQFERCDLGLLEASLFAAIFCGRISSDLEERVFCRATRLKLSASESVAAPPRSEQPVQKMSDLDLDELLLAAATEQQNPRDAATQETAHSATTPAIDRPRNRFDIASIPEQYRDPTNWPKVDVEPNGKKAKRLARYRAAFEAFFKGANISLVAKEQGLPRSEIYRVLSRALMMHPDGKIWGFRAVVSGAHLVAYTRNAAPPHALQDDTPSFAGAFIQLLTTYPDIREQLLNLALKRGSPSQLHEPRINAIDLHTEFTRLCVKAGIGATEYPFFTDDQGLRSVRRFLKEARQTDFETGARILGGIPALFRSQVGRGIESLVSASVPFDLVIQDGHKVDLLGSIGVPHPSGTRHIPMNRLTIEVVADVKSKVVLGWHPVFKEAADSVDAVSAQFKALSRWVPVALEDPPVPYPDGGGLPSGVVPELEGAAWSQLQMDSASIYTSKAILHQVRARVGCAVNFGPVGNFVRRFIIEGIFSVLAKRGFQRMPSTTGSHAKDPRREHAEQKSLSIPYQELAYLIDVAIATYNSDPKPSLGQRSPLQYLKELYSGPTAPLIPRYLPPLAPGAPEMNVTRVNLTIRGNQAQGRRPYVWYLGVAYTNSIIEKTAKLIGTRVVGHVRGNDLRSFQVFLPKGGSLGFVTAASGWNLILHDVQQRRAILKLMRSHLLRRDGAEDWVQAYLRFHAAKAAHTVKPGQPKVSKSAGEAAHTAHHSGLPMPEVDAPAHQLELRPMDAPEARPTELPPKRKARY